MLKYRTFLEKLAGRIGTFRGPVLARGPEFGDRCNTRIELAVILWTYFLDLLTCLLDVYLQEPQCLFIMHQIQKVFWITLYSWQFYNLIDKTISTSIFFLFLSIRWWYFTHSMKRFASIVCFVQVLKYFIIDFKAFSEAAKAWCKWFMGETQVKIGVRQRFT